MFTRFQVERVHDEGDVQLLTGRGLAGERFADAFRLVRLQGHGMSTVPPVGSVGLAAFPFGGDRRRGYLLGLENIGSRPKSTPDGGAVLYDNNGNRLTLKGDKSDWDHGNQNHHMRRVQKVKVEAGTWIWLHVEPGAGVYLGNGPPFHKVMTEAGPSNHVYAAIDDAAPPNPTPGTI